MNNTALTDLAPIRRLNELLRLALDMEPPQMRIALLLLLVDTPPHQLEFSEVVLDQRGHPSLSVLGQAGKRRETPMSLALRAVLGINPGPVHALLGAPTGLGPSLHHFDNAMVDFADDDSLCALNWWAAGVSARAALAVSPGSTDIDTLVRRAGFQI